MSDAFPEPNALEERSLELREHDEHPLPLEADEADALDQYRALVDPEPEVGTGILDGIDEADALDQARVISFDDEDAPRDG